MAKLKSIVKSLEEVDEKFRDLYEKQGEDFVLSGLEVDESDLKKKVDEFRTNNRALKAEHDKALANLAKLPKDFDPEKWQKGLEALSKVEEIENKQLVEKGDIDALFTKRSESMRADYEKRLSLKEEALKKTAEEKDRLSKKLGSHLIDAEISKAITKVGTPRKGAMQDLIARARSVWHLDENGNITPRDPRKPDEIMYGKDGEMLRMDEWASAQLEEASYLFEPSRGGGAEGSEKAHDGVKYIDGNDPVAVGKNLDGIISGKVKVR